MSHPSIVLAVLGGLLLALPAQPQDECRERRIEAGRLVAAHEYAEAARIYTDLTRAEPRCPALDQVLFNLAIAYRGAGLVGRAIQVRSVLITQFPSSPHDRPLPPGRRPSRDGDVRRGRAALRRVRGALPRRAR